MYWVCDEDGEGDISYASENKAWEELAARGVVLGSSVGGNAWGSIWHDEANDHICVQLADGGTDEFTIGNTDGTGLSPWYLYKFQLNSNGTLLELNNRTIQDDVLCTNF